ncbi:MAG: hypothetical protein IRZ11_07940 [Clostridia bacterium]|nr:hypothetical protein [Clostridia bacterium]
MSRIPEETLRVADRLAAAMAREMRDDRVAGAALPLALLAALLARALYAPDLVVLGSLGLPLAPSAWWPGSGFRLSLARAEALALRHADGRFALEDAFASVFRGRFAIWISPAQVDATGSANLSAIGDWRRPKVALVGSRGLPDDAGHIPMRYYLPRHEPRHLPAAVDFRSAPGRTPEDGRRGRRRGGPEVLVTPLGVFRFRPEGVVADSLFEGVTPEEVTRRTGFPVTGLPEAGRTPPPTAEETAWIRRLDPFGIRALELLPPREARLAAAAIAEAEGEGM